MTKFMTKAERQDFLASLPNIIVQRIARAGPAGLMIPEINEGLACSHSTIRTRLESLEATGRVYRERHTAANRTSIYFTWHAGAEPEIAAADALAAAPGEIPQQICTRTYTPIDRRDHLVEALFGPARTEAT